MVEEISVVGEEYLQGRLFDLILDIVDNSICA